MENKKKTYLLLVVVLIVWGLIAYKIYNAVNPSTPKIVVSNTVSRFKPYQLTKNDSFSIQADYRDPFLGKLIHRKIKTSVKKQSKKPKIENQEKIVFPKINYKGIVSPRSRLDKRFIININQQTNLFKLLATHQDVQLLQGDSKEIVISYKGKQKTIPLK